MRGQGQGVGSKKQGDGGADYCIGPNGQKKPHTKGKTCKEQYGTGWKGANEVKNEALADAKQAQEARAKQCSISIKDSGNITKPKKYSNVPDSMFADCTNFSYPIDKEHILSAIQYFNDDGQREAGGYSTAEWSKMGNRIAQAAGKGYKYQDGKVKRLMTESIVKELLESAIRRHRNV